MEAIPAVGVNSAEQVEALGFRHAISTANIHGAGDYLLEGDAKNTVQMLQGRLNAKANLEVIISDCFNLASLLNSCSFNFVSQTCNKAARVVAKYTLISRDP